LELHQLGIGGTVVAFRVGWREHIEVGLTAEIGQQQETALEVFRQHLRHAHPTLAEDPSCVHEGSAVLVRRRRVHGDEAAAGGIDQTEVTAETGIGRGRLDARVTRLRQPGEPFTQGGEPCITGRRIGPLGRGGW